ncbi:MAG TPA: alanyl-tRNA editing protein [Rhodospirillales bacterium]|jgi:misacylated tRNA(Ala) deacylase|nr:alanyl-tRNA editing protein [Rhodospirillales bacterium]HJO68871.1 alanyl-tRNA editing protein [Rhodospirillales bacterium]
MTEEIFRDDPYARSCEAVVTALDADGIRLDRTVFYAEGGGQRGDIGRLSTADGRAVEIVDTRKHAATGEHLHVPAEGGPSLSPGDAVTAEIDWERRHRLMRVHTCLHLLCAVVPGGVTGGSVGPGKGRLDFDLPETALDKERIGVELNRLIQEDHPVGARWIGDEELARNPELVRTMSVQPPKGQGRVRLIDVAGVDLQPCGGTHVRTTGEIGRVRIGKIENKGRHNRRVNIALEE